MKRVRETQGSIPGEKVPREAVGALLLGAVFIVVMGGLELAGVISPW